MNHEKKEIVLSGSVSDVSRPRVESGYGEQVTFAIDGAALLGLNCASRTGMGGQWVTGCRFRLFPRRETPQERLHNTQAVVVESRGM
jgi:hypothetical protein